jgi:hypothetical protein
LILKEAIAELKNVNSDHDHPARFPDPLRPWIITHQQVGF